jgi:hypothetical protein
MVLTGIKFTSGRSKFPDCLKIFGETYTEAQDDSQSLYF